MKLKSYQSLAKTGFEPAISGLNARVLTTTLQMLFEEIAIDAISATASGTVVMTSMELFAIVTQVYSYISMDFLYVGQIQSLISLIQSAQCTTYC